MLHYGDLSDGSALARLLGEVGLTGSTTSRLRVMRVSFDSPEYTTDITATGTVSCLKQFANLV